ncbi:tRNA epoxyqueuosine(34) reductase QueG [Reyranella sp.]|uniref:tRNA epoxyqueuosine(34) reductase QueG n=1 Tax=Reyranella sp. TaxID=1929291 RepID=UPI00121960BF|nr:tRNA epoxyqueuosine(34) reductase QueG [Reyranella sp.]TAJ86552.1 MAG: tRNA epoxyqueuosine(34) reductase QueG [Reyranella sp.]
MTRRPPTPTRPPQRASPRALRDAIRDKALALGFDAVGFAPARLAPDARRQRLERLAAFVDQGFHGDMGWLSDRAEERIDPETLWPDAKTVVSVVLNYGPASDPRSVLAESERAAVSVYAQGRDYHDVMKTRLKALGRFIWDTYQHDLKVFVDTAPLMEKLAAQQAGHGWQGKHTNLVSRQFGSWLFLGELLLSVELPADEPEKDHCGQCRACLDVCPTNAFPAPYRLDARRCISYLTIEHEGAIDRALRPALGNRIYGCDDCLAVCPWNKFAQEARETAFVPRAVLDGPHLADLATLDDQTFRTRFSGTAVKRIGRDRFLRNVAYALGNSRTPATSLPAVERLLKDASPLVRGAAVWALSQLAPAEFERRRRTVTEPDAEVCDEWSAPLPEERTQ